MVEPARGRGCLAVTVLIVGVPIVALLAFIAGVQASGFECDGMGTFTGCSTPHRAWGYVVGFGAFALGVAVLVLLTRPLPAATARTVRQERRPYTAFGIIVTVLLAVVAGWYAGGGCIGMSHGPGVGCGPFNVAAAVVVGALVLLIGLVVEAAFTHVDPPDRDER